MSSVTATSGEATFMLRRGGDTRITRAFSGRLVLVRRAIEPGYGQAPVLSASDAILATNIRLTPMEGQDVSRDLELPFMGAEGTIPADIHVRMQFNVELVASGAAGQAPADLLPLETHGPHNDACNKQRVRAPLRLAGGQPSQGSARSSSAQPVGMPTETAADRPGPRQRSARAASRCSRFILSTRVQSRRACGPSSSPRRNRPTPMPSMTNGFRFARAA